MRHTFTGMRKIPQLLVAVALAAVFTLGLVPGTSGVPGASSALGDAPAGAAGYYHPVNQITTVRYVINGCYMRLWYGNYFSAPFAKIRYYAGTSCGTMRPVVNFDDGTGTQAYGGPLTTSSGTDRCGAYFEAQDTYPGVAFAVSMTVESSPGVGPIFGTTYAGTWPVTSNC